jgi:hypothetical protein
MARRTGCTVESRHRLVDMSRFSAGSFGGFERGLAHPHPVALPLDRLMHTIERERQKSKPFFVHGIVRPPVQRPLQQPVRFALEQIQSLGIGVARLRQHGERAVGRVRRRVMLVPVNAASDRRIRHAKQSTQHPGQPNETLECIVEALLLAVNIGRHPGMRGRDRILVGIGSLYLVGEWELGVDLAFWVINSRAISPASRTSGCAPPGAGLPPGL